jgi:hypothetical protein
VPPARAAAPGGGDAGTPFAPSRGAAVSDVKVDGAKASATAALQGGDLDGQKLAVGLVEQGDVWKIDRIDGLQDRRAPAREVRLGVRADVRTALKAGSPTTGSRRRRVHHAALRHRAVPNDRLADQYEGKLPPGTLSKGRRGGRAGVPGDLLADVATMASASRLRRRNRARVDGRR